MQLLRVLVMCNAKVIGELTGEEINQERIMTLATKLENKNLLGVRK
jgi:ABC-type sugar transport system ATPase subunit